MFGRFARCLFFINIDTIIKMLRYEQIFFEFIGLKLKKSETQQNESNQFFHNLARFHFYNYQLSFLQCVDWKKYFKYYNQIIELKMPDIQQNFGGSFWNLSRWVSLFSGSLNTRGHLVSFFLIVLRVLRSKLVYEQFLSID